MSFFHRAKHQSLDDTMDNFSRYLSNIGITNIRKCDQPSKLYIGDDRIISTVQQIVFPHFQDSTIAVFGTLKSGIKIQTGIRRAGHDSYIIQDDSLLTLPWPDTKDHVYTSADFIPLLHEATSSILTQDHIIMQIKAAGQNGRQSPLILKQHPNDPYDFADTLRGQIKEKSGYSVPVLPAAQHWVSSLTASFGRMVHGHKLSPPIKDFKIEQREHHQAITDDFMDAIAEAMLKDTTISGLGDTLRHLTSQANAVLAQSRIDVSHVTTQERGDLIRTFNEMQMLTPHVTACSDQDRIRALESLCERFDHVLDSLEQKRMRSASTQIDAILDLRTLEN